MLDNTRVWGRTIGVWFVTILEEIENMLDMKLLQYRICTPLIEKI